MTQPLVSIVTPSLNQGRFIEAAIESILRQDYPRIEYAVVDGGSRDGTLQILERYTGRLRWRSEADAGQAQAINAGLREASGQVLGWLNADDILLPGAVRAVVDAMTADQTAMLVYGEGLEIDEAGKVLGPFPYTEPFNLRRLVEVHDYILQPAAFFRREALQAVGYLDGTLGWCMDWDLWIRIARRFSVRYLPVRLAGARIHARTKTHHGGVRRYREIARVVRRYSDRRFPPALFLYGVDTGYRAWCRWTGRPHGRHGGEPRRPLLRAWGWRMMQDVLESGRLPWERRADPELIRPRAGRPA